MKKNTMKIVIVVFSVLILLLLVLLYVKSLKIPLKNQVIVLEYGDKLNIDKNEILASDNQSIIDSIVVDTSKIVNEDQKDYPKIGKYTISFTYNYFYMNRTDEMNVDIVDTTKPEFKKTTDEIEVNLNDEKFDFNSYFSVYDLSKVSIEYDKTKIDFSKEGSYDMVVSCHDESGNSNSFKSKVVISDNSKQTTKSKETSSNNNSNEKITPYNIKSPTIVNNIMIVNKKHPLPSTYVNSDTSKAQSQIKKMINDMRSNGYDIATNFSGYRSFQYQKNLYDNYVKNDGQSKADTYSARPGYSEHQTGLAFDLLHQSGSLVEKSKEANWIAKNAHKYGFIVRYQSGKESITGYKAEPWHLRYIGDKAIEIYNSGLCLEEYLNVSGGDY